jgi:hypothetical protein
MKRTSRTRNNGRRKNKKTEKKHNKWYQRGCQNQNSSQKGGSGILAGNAWSPSDIMPETGQGKGSAAAPTATHLNQMGGGGTGDGLTSIHNNGNHYALNTNLSQHPLASNILVEMADKMTGGRRRKSGRMGKLRKNKSLRRMKKQSSKKYKKGIKLACQHGGATEYLPMTISNVVRNMGDTVGSFVHDLQGAPSAYNYSDPTFQPISNTSQLK